MIAQRDLWKPGNLPWRAVRKGSDVYTWYEVVDKDGWEVAKYGAVAHDEHDQLFSTVALTLMAVNKTRVITVDDKQIEISWRGESETMVNL